MYQIDKVTTCFDHQRPSSGYTKQIWKGRNTHIYSKGNGVSMLRSQHYYVLGQCIKSNNCVHNYQIHLVVLQTAPFLLISSAYTTGMTYPKKVALPQGSDHTAGKCKGESTVQNGLREQPCLSRQQAYLVSHAGKHFCVYLRILFDGDISFLHGHNFQGLVDF